GAKSVVISGRSRSRGVIGALGPRGQAPVLVGDTRPRTPMDVDLDAALGQPRKLPLDLPEAQVGRILRHRHLEPGAATGPQRLLADRLGSVRREPLRALERAAAPGGADHTN